MRGYVFSLVRGVSVDLFGKIAYTVDGKRAGVLPTPTLC